MGTSSITYIYKIIGRGYNQEAEEQITFFDQIETLLQ